MDDHPDLEIGVVGLGTYGLKRADVLAGFGHRVYGSDTSPEAQREFERAIGGETFENPADLFAEGIDAAVITTPNKFHEPVAVEAMERGIDVFVEKPLAHTLESARRIADTAAATGRVCMVGFQNRFLNVCNVLKAYIDDGHFGEIRHVQAEYVRRRGVPGRGSWYTSREIAGGGAVIDIGIHVFDLLLYLFDAPDLTDVAATTRRDFGDRESYAYLDMWGEDDDAKMFDVEDSASGFLTFEGDRTATIEIAWAANAESTHAYHVYGTEGGAHLDVTDVLDSDGRVAQRLEFYRADTKGADHFADSSITTPRNDPHREQMAAFVDAVAAGEQPSTNTVAQALAVQRIVAAVYDADDQPFG